MFGWLPQPRPPHGTKMRWRDRVSKVLRKFDIDERTRYAEAQERAEWRHKWHRGLEKSTKCRLQDEQRSATRRTARSGKQPADGDTSWQPFTCDTCKRSFRRSQDIARHKWHHPDGWPSSKVQGVSVCVCVCVCVYVCVLAFA